MFRGQNIYYEMADNVRALVCGALRALHQLARNAGLIRAIDAKLNLRKKHLPYHESENALNIAQKERTGDVSRPSSSVILLF
jgi:hypothetical protein